jgi:hypothetical protein
VRLTWWVAQRFGLSRLLVPWLVATGISALVAMAVQGPTSADERLLPPPFTAQGEAALLGALFGLVAFGLATRSVRRRFPHRATGQPSSGDWMAGVAAWFCGAALIYGLLIAITFLLWV